MKVIVCGDRHWGEEREGMGSDSLLAATLERVSIYDRLRDLPRSVEVIHGCAPGADTIAGIQAHVLHLRVTRVPADWKRYGRSAGVRRNQEMLALDPDLVIAFHRDLLSSKGTRHMVTIARKAGVPVEVIGG